MRRPPERRPDAYFDRSDKAILRLAAREGIEFTLPRPSPQDLETALETLHGSHHTIYPDLAMIWHAFWRSFPADEAVIEVFQDSDEHRGDPRWLPGARTS